MESLSALPIDGILKISLVLLAVGMLALFWWRAGTTQSIMERVWRIIAGNSPVKDPRLSTFIDEARELERFRFIFGIKVGNLAEAHRLLDWREQHGIPISELQSIRNWIDTRLPNFITEPRPLLVVRLFASMVLCLAAIVAIAILINGSWAYLKTKQSQVWFVSDGVSIERPFGIGRVEPLECKTPLSAPAGFTVAERDILCSALQDGSLQELVDKTVKAQRRFSLWGTSFIFLLFLYFSRQANAAFSARELVARIRKSSGNK